MRITILLFLAFALPASVVAQTADEAVVRAADAFTAAIVAHDSLAAAGLLAEDARILEGGRIETRDEYLAHHFHSDAAYLAGVERDPLSRRVRREGDTAWVMSSTRMTGTFRDRVVDSISAELLVLHRTEDGWKVAAVHWSSRRAPE